MTDQISVVSHNHQHITGAISNAEQLLFCDDNENGDDPFLDDFVNGLIEDISGNQGNTFPHICENVSNESA